MLTIEASITITNCVIASSARAMFFARGPSREGMEELQSVA